MYCPSVVPCAGRSRKRDARSLPGILALRPIWLAEWPPQKSLRHRALARLLCKPWEKPQAEGFALFSTSSPDLVLSQQAARRGFPRIPGGPYVLPVKTNIVVVRTKARNGAFELAISTNRYVLIPK